MGYSFPKWEKFCLFIWNYMDILYLVIWFCCCISYTVSDIASVTLPIYSGYLSRKPADISHPFGHEMVKNIASLIAAVVFITIMSFELFKEG